VIISPTIKRPNKLCHYIGERLHIRLYQDKLEAYVGQAHALTLPRTYPKPGESRARRIDYKHVIRALAAKPQAFRYSQLRDDLLPSKAYKTLWEHANRTLAKHEACKWIVTVLRLAYEYDCESQLATELLNELQGDKLPDIKEIQTRFLRPSDVVSEKGTPQHDLAGYDELLASVSTQSFVYQEVTL